MSVEEKSRSEVDEAEHGQSFATRLVHAGERLKPRPGMPSATPIYAASTYIYETMAEVERVFTGEQDGYVYTRFGNPTVHALEVALRELEAGAGAVAYASGMAALHAALLACELESGAVVLSSQDLYGATTNLLHTIFGQYGIRVVMADFCQLEELRERARETKPGALIVETISNPLLKVCDLEACAEIAHQVGAKLIVDNTFASPYLCQPLRHGADIVVHSATKYLGGHGDAMGGVAVARDMSDLPALTGTMKLAGGILSVWEAHEILRGIKTLGIRMERQCDNARRLAEHFVTHPKLTRVYYPGLSADDTQNHASRRMLRAPHSGALISLELNDNTRAAAYRFMDALRLCLRSTSLGDVFTSALHPVTASHREISPAERQRIGITDGLVRLSIGIEDVGDIIADIEQALNAV